MRRWRRIFRRDPSAEVDEELRYHVERRVAENIGRGMEPEEARRAALERLGDLERVRVECASLFASDRRGRERRRWLRVSWLDVKLGVRMLAKYPGLSLVSVLGMAVAIAVGAGGFAFFGSVMDPTLPLFEGDRVVSLQNVRADDPSSPERRALSDFRRWRTELSSVRDLSAFRTDTRNLVTADGATELVRVAEMTASGFRVARVPALLGRTLLDEDERAGAPAVVVIAYDGWQRRFGGDPGIVGRVVRLGATPHTVIGVMPEGFRFPTNHRYWVPLRLDPSDYAPGAEPSIEMFGRLADGVTFARANAELATIGARMAALDPAGHGNLRPRLLPYAYPFFDVDSPQVAALFRSLQLALGLLLVVVSVNVAILVYARTVTRVGEIAVRTALGASRRRVLAQLFVEGLVLSLVAAAIGLAFTVVALGRVEALIQRMDDGSIPFWWHLSLTPGVVAYVAGLALLGGVITGVLPALRATGPGVLAGLQQLSARGSRMQLGRVWTTLIVVQVAVAVAALPAAVFWPGMLATFGAADPGYPVAEFATAYLSMERDESPPTASAAEYEREFAARFDDRVATLVRRLESRPGVEVTFAAHYPGRSESLARIRLEAMQARPVLVNHVDVRLFGVFDVPILAGRGFDEADTRAGATAVIVDQTFVDRIAGGGNVVGRRLRYITAGGQGEDADPGPWFEIVGVVPAFPAPMLPLAINEIEPRLFQPVAPVHDGATLLIVRDRNRAGGESLEALRNVTAAIDPALQLHELSTVTESTNRMRQALRTLALGIVIVTLSVILLSAAGIYAMMSFTVARRRREIGIRSALGADSRRVLTGIFARAGAQLGAGIMIGLALAAAIERGSGGMVMGGHVALVLPIVSVLIVTVGLLAALGPARRGLAIPPTEALRAE